MAQQTSKSIIINTTPSGLYWYPELISTTVLPDCIKLIYKRQYIASYNWGTPESEIYAEVYSRTDGSMRIVKGEYIPAQPESYLLDE